MSPALFLALLVLAALVWFWSDTLSARERVLLACSATCMREGVQFLDQTVALVHFRLTRQPNGQLAFKRLYRFEFSTDGADRHAGEAVIHGSTVLSVRLGRTSGRDPTLH